MYNIKNKVTNQFALYIISYSSNNTKNWNSIISHSSMFFFYLFILMFSLLHYTSNMMVFNDSSNIMIVKSANLKKKGDRL